jgi:zinc transporter
VETADSTYGSDKDGLVCGYLLVPGAPATPIDADAAADWLAAPARSPADAFVWLNFSLANAASERWIRRHLSLPESSLESLHEDIGSTRLEQDGDALVAVIHDVLFDFTFDPGSVSTVSLCVEPSFLLSARLRPLRSVDRLRASVKTGQTFRSSAHLLGHLLRDQAEVLVNIVRQSTIRVDFIEDKLLADRISTSRRDLGSLRRTLVRLQRLLAPEPAALFRLLNRPPAWIGGEDVQDLREAAEEFSAAVLDSGALVERVKLLQEELAAQINEQTNRTLFILTVVTVLALPINLIAGLFGMNVGGIPLAEHRHGFRMVVLPLLALTMLLGYLALWRRRE